MRAFAHLPIVEAEPGRFGDVSETPLGLSFGAAVDVPLADVTGRVTRLPETAAQRRARRLQLDIVHHQAMARGILAGHQRAPIRAAHREAGDGVDEVKRLARQGVDDGRPGVGVAAVAEGLGAPLVDENEDDIGPADTLLEGGLKKDAAIHTSLSVSQPQPVRWRTRVTLTGVVVGAQLRPSYGPVTAPPGG